MSKYLSTFVTSTAFKYLVGIVAGWLALKLGLDPTEGKASIQGALSALAGLGMLVWGAHESGVEKVVAKDLDGNLVRTPLKDMPAATVEAVKTVTENKPRTLQDVLSNFQTSFTKK